MAIMAALFFTWGFTRGMSDILIPHLRDTFDLSYARTMLIQISFFSAYLLSIPAGNLIGRIGYKKTIIAGLVALGGGAVLFFPAASVASFPLFLLAVMIIATGITMLQVSANPYTAAQGPPRTAASRLNLVQGFNALGRTISPLIASVFLLTSVPAGLRAASGFHSHALRLQQAAQVKFPYLGLAIAAFALAIIIGRLDLPEMFVREDSGHITRSVYRHSRVLLGGLGIFAYVGAEASIAGLLVNYLMEPGVANLPQRTAGYCVSLYFGAAVAGRFIGSVLLRKIPTGKLLGIFSMAAVLLIVTSVTSSGSLAMWSILLVGLCNSIMFASIFAMSIDGLGPDTASGSGLLLTATVGGAIIPELQGLLADRIGLHPSFVLPIICYLYITHFALKGSAVTSRVPQLAMEER